MADIFSIIADPTRRQLLGVLLDRAASESVPRGGATGPDQGEHSVSELVTRLELSQPTVSKHLKVLRDADLVLVREEGQHRYYRLNAAPLRAVEDWIDRFVVRPPVALVDHAVNEVPVVALREASALGKVVGRGLADSAHRARVLAGRIRIAA